MRCGAQRAKLDTEDALDHPLQINHSSSGLMHILPLDHKKSGREADYTQLPALNLTDAGVM